MSLNVQLFPDALDAQWLVSSNVAYNDGDLLYDSGASGIALPGGSQASQGSEAADQALFASKFIGVCVSGASAAQSLANTNTPLTVDMGRRVWLCTCPSQTFKHGDLVGIYSDGTHSPDPQKVDACGGDPARAIGRVFGYYSSATTQVQVVFDPVRYNGVPGSFLGASAGSQTFGTGSQTITTAMPMVIRGAPTGAASYALPAEATAASRLFLIEDNGSGSGSITVTAANTIFGTAIIAPGFNLLVGCDGTNYWTVASK